ncbi:MAG: hypothetical protein ACREV2_04415 [Burkholderiales bacterium]
MRIALVLFLATTAVARERWERIWKYQVPAGIVGEFGNEDPVGLAAGKHIRTDCGIRWVADDGKNHCFNSGTHSSNFSTNLASTLNERVSFG